MAQYTDQAVEDLLPPPEQTPNTLRFFRWILAIFQYFFNYTNASIFLNNQLLSGQVGVLVNYCKVQIGVDIEVKDSFSFVSFYPYRNPYHAEIVISADATPQQFEAVVELFNFYRLGGKKFVFNYGDPAIPTDNSAWTYFEIGFNDLPAADSYTYFELGLTQ